MKLHNLLKQAAETIDANAATISTLQAKLAKAETALAAANQRKTAAAKDEVRLATFAKTAADALVSAKLVNGNQREAKIAELMDPVRALADLAKVASFIQAPRLGQVDTAVQSQAPESAEDTWAAAVNSVNASLPR